MGTPPCLFHWNACTKSSKINGFSGEKFTLMTRSSKPKKLLLTSQNWLEFRQITRKKKINQTWEKLNKSENKCQNWK